MLRDTIVISVMAASFTDILSLFLSFLGIYGLVLYLRYLIPRCIIPSLSALLIETQQLLDRAEEINAISPESGYRAHLESYEDLQVCAANSSSHTLT